MPFRLGPMELVIILAIVLVVFGAARLPKLGEGLGKGLRSFRRGLSADEGATADAQPQEHRDSPAARG